jgi:hypothetical protein
VHAIRALDHRPRLARDVSRPELDRVVIRARARRELAREMEVVRVAPSVRDRRERPARERREERAGVETAESGQADPVVAGETRRRVGEGGRERARVAVARARTVAQRPRRLDPRAAPGLEDEARRGRQDLDPVDQRAVAQHALEGEELDGRLRVERASEAGVGESAVTCGANTSRSPSAVQ